MVVVDGLGLSRTIAQLLDDGLSVYVVPPFASIVILSDGLSQVTPQFVGRHLSCWDMCFD